MIRNFTGNGINVASNISGSPLFVSNTLVSDNGVGIFIDGGSFGFRNAVLNHVEMQDNLGDGLHASTGGQQSSVTVTVTDSVSANNRNDGIAAISIGGTTSVMLRNSTIVNNGNNGLEANGPGQAAILVTRLTITNNPAAWSVASGGVVSSYADNNIDDTAPPNPLPYK